MYIHSKRWLFLPLLLAVLAANGAPVVRIVDAAGADKDIAINKIHKLVLTSTVVEVVNDEGSVLLSVPVSDIVRVELTDSESSATLEQQTIDLAEFEYRNSAKLKKKSPIWLSLIV